MTCENREYERVCDGCGETFYVDYAEAGREYFYCSDECETMRKEDP